MWKRLEPWQKVALGSAAVIGIVALFRRDSGPAGVARREARWWEGMTEDDPEALPKLREYWAAALQPFPGLQEPWSAAFISWAVAASDKAGALEPSGAHIFYTRAAYWNRGEPGRYGAYRPEETPLQPGDIIVRGRAGYDLTWADIAQGGDYVPTHGDIVTSVSRDSALIVGGNVGNAVKEREIELWDGYAPSPPYAAVLRLQPGRLAA